MHLETEVAQSVLARLECKIYFFKCFLVIISQRNERSDLIGLVGLNIPKYKSLKYECGGGGVL